MDGTATDHPPLPWPLPDGEGLKEALLAAYGDPARGYHDVRHLGEVLGRLRELADAGTAFDEAPVLLAAWFHDAVYDGERDAEERSAAWAEEALPSLVDAGTTAEVARLVRLTESHRPDDADANGCALSDADLGILAAPRERYDEYVAAVRAEYSHLSDEVGLLTGMSVPPLNSWNGVGLVRHEAKWATSRKPSPDPDMWGVHWRPAASAIRATRSERMRPP